MDAVVIENPLRIVRLAGQVGLGQFRPESSGLDKLRGGDVVGMGVYPIGGEDPSRPGLPEHAGQFRPGRKRRFQTAIRQPQVFPPIQAQNFRGGLGFSDSDFRSSERALARRRSNREPQPVSPSDLNFSMAPPIPSSASSGWGATTRMSSSAFGMEQGLLLRMKDER